MRPLTDQQIRRALINCSRGEAKGVTTPRNLATLDWAELDFLGWRDQKAPLRGYVLTWRDDEPVGIALRAAEGRMSGRVAGMCSLCRTGRPADSISLFTAKRLGESGRNGNTVGTYICADLACSQYVRVEKATASLRPAPGLTVQQRVDDLLERLDGFIDEVRRPA